MTTGPGKYDALATRARETAKAWGVILIVIGGNKGSGFSCQGPPGLLKNLAGVLRDMADDIEKDMR